MVNTVLIDTNMYLDDAKIIYKLSREYEKTLIPLTVLKELDKKKFDKDMSYSARNALKSILSFIAENKDRVIFDIERYKHLSEPDEKILASAEKYRAVVATKDVSMSIQAGAMGLEYLLHDLILNNVFNPYINIHMNDLHKETEDDIFDYKSEYLEEDYQRTVYIFSVLGKRKLSEDSWWFVIIDNDTKNPVVYANNPIKLKIERIDDKPKYRKIDVDKDASVKALDPYQNCAIYAMIEAPNVLMCGSYGSGKSLLSTAYSMAYNDRKTFISRPNLTVDRRFELGFLPGSVKEKLSPWMAGFMSSLYYMFSNTKGQTTEKMEAGSYDYVKEQVFDRYFEMLPLETLQGMSFLKGDLLLLDETQLCSISILSVILSRFGKGSKLIATGDVKQIYGVIQPSESGLMKLIRLLPHKHLAYVVLKHNYRSELLELADELQNKSLM